MVLVIQPLDLGLDLVCICVNRQIIVEKNEDRWRKCAMDRSNWQMNTCVQVLLHEDTISLWLLHTYLREKEPGTVKIDA